ncbi:PhzF family phenazine biosynthesis protein [Kribbella sp.]|uniref:PhzF family phenazine biosynthesis protein n=1 Tax=Kribbella sp. TaxID=1871183 RepID=UPI002D5EB54D|nr:PhzF family phenazine biosynthesis protein [Kribbella sp.]HZX07112.1 PhzF family phenazine biosynthesis protein [Kribbella sp.]
MTARRREFVQVDVFASTPYLGNPVAVVLDGTDLADDQLQQVARWTNLSETTFVLPPTSPAADYRLRIFTPGGELPFAGHPTLGSARAWLDTGGVPRRADLVVQECAIGLVKVRRTDDTLAFAAPPLIRSGAVDEEYVGQLVDAFGITRDQVIDHQWVDNGPGWAVLRLATAAEVLALEPDLSRIPTAMVGALGAYPAGSPHTFELRTFAPGAGVPEDPACGSMNAGIARWLAIPEYQVSQGARLARAASISVTTDRDGTIWVGGSTTPCIHGTITI